MNLFKRLWRKLFGVKTGAFDTLHVEYWHKSQETQHFFRPAYDPFEDEEKIMKGEVESYFD